jgi:hypothetical protein
MSNAEQKKRKGKRSEEQRYSFAKHGGGGNRAKNPSCTIACLAYLEVRSSQVNAAVQGNSCSEYISCKYSSSKYSSSK